MDEIDALARRLPEHVWTMRQLHRRDEEFRSVCEDYGEALRALEHWQRVGGPSHARVQEYRELARELEDQALAYVTSHGAR
jgi:hypothetical protein